MKKLSILAIALLLVSIIAVPVFAAQTASISVTASSNTVSRGDTVTVTVSTSEVTNCVAGGFMFDYNTDVFEYVSGSAVMDYDFTAGVTTANDIVSGYFMNNNLTVQGDLFQITLKVKDTAAYGDYTVSGTANIVANLNDVDEEVSCTVSNATITVACKHTNSKYDNNGDGTHTVICSDCGTVTNAAEDHTDANSDNICDACDASLMMFYRSNTSGGDLMLGDDIRGSFIVNVKNLDYDEVYLEITMAGATSKAYKTENSTSTYAYFAYVVPAPRMTENITLTICGVRDGVVYRGETLNWTIRAAVEGKLAAWFPNYETNEAMALRCDLLVSMLHYGEKAQLQFGINTDKLATTDLAPEYLALVKTDMPAVNSYPVVDETGKTATLGTMSLMLQEKVKMAGNFKITSGFTAAEDYEVVIQHTKSKDGAVVTYTVNSDEFTVSGSSTKYIQFTFDKLAGAQLRDDLKITLYQNGEPVSLTYTRSAEMVADTYQARLPDLIAAIMNYADCAKAVFG